MTRATRLRRYGASASFHSRICQLETTPLWWDHPDVPAETLAAVAMDLLWTGLGNLGEEAGGGQEAH